MKTHNPSIAIGAAAIALFLTMLAEKATAVPIQTAALPKCGCYYSSDCAKDQYCSIINPFCLGPADKSNCECSGKNDGVCKDNPTQTPPSPASAYDRLVSAVNLYFEAYEVPIGEGEGRVDLGLLVEATSVNLTGTGMTPAQLHHLVASAVDATIGFDLIFPNFQNAYTDAGGRGPIPVGNVRGTPDESIELVAAARQGMVEALRTRNFNAVDTFLTAFWTLHPDYHPNHTGRLYPHGHTGTEDLVPLEAQVSTLKLLLKQMLHDTLPTCGNDVLEQGEVCDGSLDAACSGAGCSLDCTCNTITLE